MQNSEQAIELIGWMPLCVAFAPVLIVLFLQWKKKHNYKNGLWGSVRMVTQLIVVGYLLTFVFSSESPWVISVVLVVMLLYPLIRDRKIRANRSLSIFVRKALWGPY